MYFFHGLKRAAVDSDWCQVILIVRLNDTRDTHGIQALKNRRNLFVS